MQIKVPATVVFEIWYQSRVSIAAAAAFMSMAASRILLGSIDWRITVVITLCTASAYWLDDYLDHHRCPSHAPPFVRTLKLAATVSAVAVIIFLIHSGPAELFLLGSVLGASTFAFCVISSRISERTRGSRLWIVPRSISISLVWSAAVVLMPVFARKALVTFQILSAIFFIWALMFVVTAMWGEGEHATRYQLYRKDSYNWLLHGACALAAILVVSGVIAGYFPWTNLALLAACVLNTFFVAFRQRFEQTDRRVINELMILMNIFGCLFAIGAYEHPIGDFGPGGVRDWFQLAATAIFFGNIWVKSATLHARDDNGDYLDVLFVLGLGLLGFQIMVSCVHLESWLFPWLYVSFFHSRITAVAGAILIALSLILQTWAYVSMANSWRLMANSSEPAELVTSGPFAWSRNPIYLSAELYIAGIFLMNGILVFALFLLLAPMLLHIQIRREEAFLLKQYKADYEDYMYGTPRYLLVRGGC